MQKEGCRFCAIARGDTSETLIYEDAFCVAVNDPLPRARGHYIVIPKKHFDRLDVISEADAEFIGRLMLGGMAVARQTGLQEGAYHMVVNCGDQLGHRIQHLHLHIMGGA